jgi:hypothetical protein
MDNEYNRMIAAKVRQIDRNHVQRINQISETNNHDITSPLEGMTLRNDHIQGGSGFAAATVADLGFEPTDGATHTATGGGVSGGKRARAKAKSGAGISGGALLTDKDASAILRPQPPPGMEARITLQASPHKDQPIPQASNGPTLVGPLAGAGVSGGGTSGGGVSGGGTSGGGVSGGKRSSARNDSSPSDYEGKGHVLTTSK